MSKPPRRKHVLFASDRTAPRARSAAAASPYGFVAALAIAAVVTATVVLVVLLLSPGQARAAVDTAPPATPVKLVFIHHSTGQAWLADDHGHLGIALRDNGYFVSDTNYGWGPASIGDTTDIGHWWTWFRGPDADTYMTALYDESGQHCDYSRLATDPGGANEIVLFKSCFPNSLLSGGDADPVPAIADDPLKGQACGGPDFTVANAKGVYNDLLAYFAAHTDKLFVVIVAPPVTAPDTPGGRTLADWLVGHWLQDAAYGAHNVAVFDFYTVLTSKAAGGNDLRAESGNHHRVWDGEIQHVSDRGADHNVYPSAGGDSHPNASGDRKATAEFVPLLNAAYNAWKGNTGSDTIGPETFAPRASAARHGATATLYYRVSDDQAAQCVVTIRITRRDGRLVKTLRPGLQSCGALRRARFACGLAAGGYRFTVCARDFSGNAQAHSGSNRLTVR